MRAFLLALLFCFFGSVSRADTTLPHSLFSVLGEPPSGLSSDTELGFSLTSGNTDTDSLQAKEQTSYRWEVETLALQGRYLESHAQGTETAKNWASSLRYERRLAHRLGGFISQLIEADPFAGVTQRYATDIGLRRVLWYDPTSGGAIEFGYRHQIENRTTEDTITSEIVRAYFETSYRFNPNVHGNFWIEILPDLLLAQNWRADTEVALEADLGKKLSLKTAYDVRYDNLPQVPGVKTTDMDLTTAFIAKF